MLQDFEPTSGRRFRLFTRTLLTCSLALCCSLAGYAQQLQRTEELSSGTCHVRFKDGHLVIGNGHVERSWRWEDGRLYPESLRTMPAGTEWLAAKTTGAAPVGPAATQDGNVILRAAYGTFGVTEAPSMRAELAATGIPGSVQYEFQIFPQAAGVRMWIEQTAGRAANDPAAADQAPATVRPDTLERLLLRNSHLRLTQVVLRDRTDEHDELVFENEWLLQANEAPLKLQGNLFDLQDTLTGEGLVLLKEAPQPEMRPVPNAADATVSLVRPAGGKSEPVGDSYDVTFYGHGFTGSGRGYPFVLLAYSGGSAGRTAALHLYQRQVHTYRPDRDGLLLSNTWGDRSRDSRINEPFMHAEMDAAAKLGVDVVQIDDGWESGRTINASNTSKAAGIWNGYWETNPDFWKADATRLPHGLPALTDYAHARGLKLGLWFAPDSASDFQSWKKDADQIVSMNQVMKVDAFKLDSVKIHSKSGEVNYFTMLEEVQRRTSGKALIDLDVTAETRQGYFGNIAAGGLFVENRYTDTHRYWPHQTLRNLWKLSRWIDPVRLRMEFLNSDRNTALYGDDPLAPARYASSTLFATTLMSSPLAWFELTGLSDKYIADAAPLIARWKQERGAMQAGTILPIGDAPDGTTWTGFASQTTGGGGYLLVFRERNRSADWTVPAETFPAKPYRVSLLGGQGNVTAVGGGLRVHIDAPLGFVWVKLEPEGLGAGNISGVE